MSNENQDDLEVAVNKYLDSIRESTMKCIAERTVSRDAMAYMIALGTHLGELMWASKVSTKNATDFTLELFRSAYEQCDEMEKRVEQGEKNESTK